MSKKQATQLADALERLMPLIERGTKGFVFAADKAGEVIADKALLRDAPNLLRRWPDGEPVAQRVRKVGGSFQHTGVVVARFKTVAGEERIVVEFDPPVGGMLHIYRPDQVEECDYD